MGYLRRTVDTELDQLIYDVPAIALDGPKGVGKTGTAERRAVQAWYLDDPLQSQRLELDFGLETIAPEGTVLIDEWQRLPQVWDSVRRRVDRGAPGGRFLLTGSATPSTKEGTHSGAGRIMSLRMRPMGLHERGKIQPTVSLQGLLTGDATEVHGETDFSLVDYVEAIVESGFPGAMDLGSRARKAFLDAYLERVIDRDLPDLGHQVRRPEVLRRWLRAYAAATSSVTAYSRLLDATAAGDGSQPAKTTTIAYRDHLTRLFLLDPVPGWLPTNNPMTIARQAPKHQLADPALSARLLGYTIDGLLDPQGAAMLGPLFESLVTLGVRVMAQAAESTVHHLRTKGGEREIDIIVETDDLKILPIEVKLAPRVDESDVRHLLWLKEKLGDRVKDMVIVNTGPIAYRRPDGVAVVPLALLGP